MGCVLLRDLLLRSMSCCGWPTRLTHRFCVSVSSLLNMLCIFGNGLHDACFIVCSFLYAFGGAAMGVGLQLYSNAVRKLPLLRCT